MIKRQWYIYTISALLSLLVIGTVVMLFSRKEDRTYIYLNGTVSAYDESPSYSDGPIIFAIDGMTVDIGGGLRATPVSGSVYTPIQIGDKVAAKVIRGDGKYLTTYNCRSCYIRVQ